MIVILILLLLLLLLLLLIIIIIIIIDNCVLISLPSLFSPSTYFTIHFGQHSKNQFFKNFEEKKPAGIHRTADQIYVCKKHLPFPEGWCRFAVGTFLNLEHSIHMYWPGLRKLNYFSLWCHKHLISLNIIWETLHPFGTICAIKITWKTLMKEQY